MAILTTGNTYSAGDQVTPTNLNAIVNSATFNDPADETTIEKNTGTGKLQIKDGGVTAAKIGSGAVTNAKLGSLSVATANLQTNSVTSIKITDANVTTAKIASNAVTGAKLNTDAISAQTELTAAPADEDEFLISDAGVLKRIGFDTLLKDESFPKAWGKVDFAVGQETTNTGGWNVSAVAGTSTSRTVSLTNTMSSTNFIVLLTIESGLNVFEHPTFVISSTSTFVIHKTDQATDPKVNFVVFGTLA